MSATAARSSYSPPSAAASRDLAVVVESLTKRFVVRRSMREFLRHPLTTTWMTALDDVSLAIPRGEFLGLLGPNGAGKTTLFKMLATLILPDSGSAVVDGHDVVADPIGVRNILTPVIADERSLNWRLSARENLELYAVLFEVPRKERRARVQSVLANVGLENVGEKMAGAFSSGMRQRLLIARALLARPKVLLLDEPTRSLDPISARAFRRFLRDELVEKHGCTVLLATHSADEAFDLCDRVAVLNHGRLLACAPAQTLAREYGEERQHLWTTAPDHEAFTLLTHRGMIERKTILPERDGDWCCVELTLRGGMSDSAAIIATLTSEGVPVARFERLTPSLADLLERVVAARNAGRRNG
jgi:ABC-2 type transport system ATP-binding protein